MKKLYSIRKLSKKNPYAVPAPYGFLVKKTEKGQWASICYDEDTGVNARYKNPELIEYIFLESNTIAMQLDEMMNSFELEAFSKTVKNRYVPGGNYIPCLIDEKVMLIKEEFLNPIMI